MPEPDVTTLDAQPRNAFRWERLAYWLVDGRNQNAMSARDYAIRCFKAEYGKAPKQEHWSKAYEMAGRM